MTISVDTKASPDSIVNSGPSSTGIEPGKRTATQGLNYTGSSYADHGALCAKQPDQDGCFLPDTVRKPFVDETAARISSVDQVFQRACDVVRLQRLMTPATQPNFIVGILFDVLVGKWTGDIIEKFSSMRAAAVQSATAMEVELSGLMKLEASAVSSKLASATAKAKTVAIAAAGDSDVSIAQTFLSALKQSSAIGFQSLRESFATISTDSQLLVIHEAFDIKYHAQDDYEKRINAKVDRYLASGVTQIGRGADSSKRTVSSKEEADPYASVDTRVAWAKFASGYPPQLVYEHASSRDLGSKDPKQFGGGDTGPTSATVGGLPGAVRHSLVPQEFAELAIQRHTAMWGASIGTVDVDDSQWYWEPGRVAAVTNKKRASKPAGSFGSVNDGPMAHTVIPTKDEPADYKPSFKDDVE